MFCELPFARIFVNALAMASASRPPRHELWVLCQEVAKAGFATKLLFVHIPEVEAAFQGLQSVVQHLKATSTCDLSTSAALAAIVLHGVRGRDLQAFPRAAPLPLITGTSSILFAVSILLGVSILLIRTMGIITSSPARRVCSHFALYIINHSSTIYHLITTSSSGL